MKNEESKIEKDKEQKDVPNFSGTCSNEGTLSLTIYVPINQKDADEVFASFLLRAKEHMIEKGFISIDKEGYGKNIEYWKNLLKEGKIIHEKVSTNHFNINIWMPGYLNTEEEVNKYLSNIDRLVESIKNDNKKWGKTICPNCGNEQFEYSAQNNRIEGLCRANCGFRVYSYKY